jgi:transposase
VIELREIDTNEQVVVPRKAYENLEGQVAQLTYQLEQLKRMIYGAKSERFVPSDPGQATLFDVAATTQPATEQVSYTRVKTGQKKKPVREAIPAHLPRIERVIEPDNLPEGAHRIGQEITETLEYTPGTIHVDKLVRPKYVVRNGEEDQQILIAPMPSMPFPKSSMSASVGAHIGVSKFCDHLPFHRLIAQLKRAGLEVSSSTLGSWFQAMATLLEALYEQLRKEVLAQAYLQVDESPIPVQDGHNEKGIRTGYHWVYHAPLIKAVLFDYCPGRSEKFPIEVLKDFQGTLQTDGYVGYDKLAQKEHITPLACMAHARRKFEQALTNDKARAQYALQRIGELYSIERQCDEREDPPDVRHGHRQKEAVPILEAFDQWLKQEINIVAPKSPMGKALAYTIGLWPRLAAYVNDGRYLIDNNRIENTIRPMAIGRKNYLFAGSDRAAHHAAIMYSLLGTCKLHGIEPFAYLKDVFSRINDHKANKLHELLPQYWQPLAK